MLCLAKLNNLKNPDNNGWVNLDAKTIFTLARISGSVKSRYERLGSLYQMSLLELPKRNDNLSCRVTFVNNDSERKLFISDFRELGYEYLRYKGKAFSRCRECGILFRNNKNMSKKYCSACSAQKPLAEKRIFCADCGKAVFISSKNNKTYRCKECQEKADRLRKLKQ